MKGMAGMMEQFLEVRTANGRGMKDMAGNGLGEAVGSWKRQVRV